MSRYRNVNVNVAGAATIKAGAGRILRWYMTNSNAAVRYVKFYDEATVPVVGTDVPSMTIMIPAGGGSVYVSDKEGWPFANGIGIGATTGPTDGDTGAPSANDVIVVVDFV